MIDAGKLDRRVASTRRQALRTGKAAPSRVQPRTMVWANFRFLRGGETVQSARLEGRQPVVVTIRASSATKAITPEWRMRDIRTGTIYAIRTCPPPGLEGFIELTCESGVVP